MKNYCEFIDCSNEAYVALAKRPVKCRCKKHFCNTHFVGLAYTCKTKCSDICKRHFEHICVNCALDNTSFLSTINIEYYCHPPDYTTFISREDIEKIRSQPIPLTKGI